MSLGGLSDSTLRVHGLCGDHFEDCCFDSRLKIRLKRTAIPRWGDNYKVEDDPHHNHTPQIPKFSPEELQVLRDNYAKKKAEEDKKRKHEQDLLKKLEKKKARLTEPEEEKTTTEAPSDDKTDTGKDPNEPGSSGVADGTVALSQNSQRAVLKRYEYKKKIYNSNVLTEQVKAIRVKSREKAEEQLKTITTKCQLLRLEKLYKREQTKTSKLKKAVRRLQAQLRRSNEKHERDLAKKRVTVDEFLDQNNVKQAAARTIVKLQIHKPNTQYSEEMKEIAKELFTHSSAFYSVLKHKGVSLPTENIVRTWLSKVNTEPGLNPKTFKNVKEKLESLPLDERVCGLKWDEIIIKNIDLLKGTFMIEETTSLENALGRDEHTLKNCKQLYLMSLDSLNAKNAWKQMIGYFITDKGTSSDEIVELLQDVLSRLKKCGAIVRLVSCDQTPVNEEVYGETLLDITQEEPSFFFDDENVVASYDFSRLLRRFMYQLSTTEALYCEGKVIARFSDWDYAKQHDESSETSPALLDHIKAKFLRPQAVSTNVKRTFQLLGPRYAMAMKAAAKQPGASPTLGVSAEFVDKMEKVVDALNSTRLTCQQDQKLPMSEENAHIVQTVQEFIQWSSKWSLSPDELVRPDCFKGLTLTAQAMLLLHYTLTNEFPEFELTTALCSLESVDNFFGKLKSTNRQNCHLARTTKVSQSNKRTSATTQSSAGESYAQIVEQLGHSSEVQQAVQQVILQTNL